MKLEWSLFAIEDRNKIFDFIEQDDPRAAIFVDERIEEQTELPSTTSRGVRCSTKVD